MAFSDCVVRVCFLDSPWRLGALYWELSALATAQAELAKDGIFLRGGMTAGEIWCDGSNAFGPALVRAHELESVLTDWPRIIVDDCVLDHHQSVPALQGDAHDLARDKQYIEALIRRDDVNCAFVDYVGGVKEDFEADGLYEDWLRSHKLAVASALSVASDVKIQHKYRRLANYHNQVVVENFDQDAAHLRIA